MKNQVKVLLFVVLALSLVLAACQPAAAPAAEEPAADEEPVAEEMAEDSGPKEVLKFADSQFQSLWINNEIAMFIANHGYGYPVESIEMTTVIASQSLSTGDVDVFMELWRANWIDYYNEQIAEGNFIDLGETYDRSVQGWYVPRYVVEGDAERGIEAMAPDLKSVTDLPQYAELFSDPEEPEKGQFVSCITGWECAEINRVKFYAYGLEDTFNILEPGSSGALDAAIAGAYKKGDPIVSYYWEPTWLIGLYDMILLEEPAYTAECWAALDEVRQGTVDESLAGNVPVEAGCAYESVGIHKGVTAGLPDRAPEIVEMLEKLFIPTDDLNKVAAYMTSEDVEASDAAIWYLQNYEDQWTTWVTPEAAEAIKAALQ